jgi:hypothetical protein
MSDTVKSAVEANDYSKLSTDEQSKVTKEQFAQMVTVNKAMISHQAAIESAVKANDFTSFKKAHTDFKALMDANKPADMTDDKTRPDPTDDELKQRFEKLVEYYKTNGKLPEMKMGMDGQKGEKGMMKGDRGQKRGQKNQSVSDSSTTK